jgi:UDP-glucose 4-epimerase
MNIAIIGANGFIGRHLTQALARQDGLKLFLFGKGPAPRSDHEYKTLDFHNAAQMADDFKGIDVVYYLASETIPATSWNNPRMEVEKNLLPFISFLETVSVLSLRKIVFVSSAGTVYGPTTGKVNETSDKHPFSPYGIIKLTMENFLNYYKVKHELNYDVFRVSNVYGEGQNTGKGLGVINTFIEKIILEKKVKVFGDGEATRNYIYVRDVARLLLHSVNSPGTSDTFNVSSDATLSLKQLLKEIKDATGENFEVLFEGGRQSDNSFIDLDNSKILGRFPDFKFTALSEGITKTYSHIKEELKLNGKK